VVPISAQLKYNIDVICEYIVKKIPIPERNFTCPANMIVIRSFDVNKPGSEVNDIKGGVAGGSILKVCNLISKHTIIHICMQYFVLWKYMMTEFLCEGSPEGEPENRSAPSHYDEELTVLHLCILIMRTYFVL